ncbi:MAG: hypothetical protein K2P99_07360, partial [Burkholderiales bacterium]|nr:hypothetical protein [Burkholderiales bacterium]
KNSLLKSLLLISLQLILFKAGLSSKSFQVLINNYTHVGLIIVCGVSFSIFTYYLFKHNIHEEKDAFNYSTLGVVVEYIAVKSLSDIEVSGILSNLKFKSSLEIASKAKAGITSYPLLFQYFVELNNSVNHEVIKDKWFYKFAPSLLLNWINKIKYSEKHYLREVIVDLISYLNQNKHVRASVVEVGHGGVSILEHSLNVVECSLELFNHDVFVNLKQLKDSAVILCLAHDIGKIKCHMNGQNNFNGHERLSYQMIGLFESFAMLGDYNPHLKDTITTAVRRQGELIVNDINEQLVALNHIYKTSDQKASEIEGQSLTLEKVNEIYRTAFYILLTDKKSMSKCATLVNGCLFLDAHKFVGELIKFTGQTFTVENYANTKVFKQIKQFMVDDGLFFDKITDICSIVMHDKTTGKEIKRIQQCLILRMDFILFNDNIKLSDVEVNAEVNNRLIARLVFQNNSIQFVQSINKGVVANTIAVSETNNNVVEYVQKEEENHLIDMTTSLENTKKTDAVSKLDATVPILTKNTEPKIEQKPQNKNKLIATRQRDVWSLEDVNNYFLNELRNAGVIINEIKWNTQNQRYKVDPTVGVNATVTAHIDGKIMIYYSIYSTIDFNDSGSKISKQLTLPPPKHWVDATIEYYENNIKWDQGVENSSISYIHALNLFFKISDVLCCGVYKEKLAVKVKNFQQNLSGVMIYNNGLDSKNALIPDVHNHIMVGTEENLRILNQVFLVDNLADALVLYNILNINVIVYFSAERIIEKISELYPEKDIIIFVNFNNISKILQVAERLEVKLFCYNVNNEKLFDTFNQKIILPMLKNNQKIPLVSELISSYNIEVIEKIYKQLKTILVYQNNLSFIESLNNVKNVYAEYSEKFEKIE